MNEFIILSIEDDTGMHCVDFIDNDDGSFCYKVFARIRKTEENGR